MPVNPQPRVSVVLPVRNGRATLPACLASLAAQTLVEHEVVIVDDGSSDGTAELLDRAAGLDARLRVQHAEARGLVSALNAGLALARADLIARMDADDMAHPERLARQEARLRADTALNVLGCCVDYEGPRTTSTEGMRAYVDWSNTLLTHEQIVRDLFVESPLIHPSVMMRRAAVGQLAGYRDIDGPEDYDLWLRAHHERFRFAKLAERLLTWRDHPARLTRVDPRYGAEGFAALKLAALEQGALARPREVVLWGAGPIGKTWRRHLIKRGHTIAAMIDVDPNKIGQRIDGTEVISIAQLQPRPGQLHFATVGQREARERIRLEIERHGLSEGQDFFALA